MNTSNHVEPRNTSADAEPRSDGPVPEGSAVNPAIPADLQATAASGQSVAGGTAFGGFRINHNQSLLQD